MIRTGRLANTVEWQWYRGNSLIATATNGEGTITSMYTPAAGDVGSVLRAVATYRDGEDPNNDKTARGESFRSVRSAPGSNTDPAFPDPGSECTPTFRKIRKGKWLRTRLRARTLGAPVSATDAGDLLTYSLGGANADSFDINRATGQLTTKAALDAEDTDNPANDEFQVTVTATDPFGASDMANVTITVTDVNEDPMVTGVASIDHEEGATVLDTDAATPSVDPAVYTAEDEDAEDDAATGLRWLLSGPDASKFAITDSGAARTLSFMDAPNYESPGDPGGDNVYEVTVVVTDSKGNTDEQAVTVKVTNMEEPGVVELSTLQPRSGFPVTATPTDPDNIIGGQRFLAVVYRGSVTIDLQDTINYGLPTTECVEAATNNCLIKGATSATYTPVVADIGNGSVILTAVVFYTDGSPNMGDAKDVVGLPAMNPVLADTRNKAPVFSDQDPEMDGDQTDQERSVRENTPSGTSIGTTDNNNNVTPDPVTAMDFITMNNGTTTVEVLTYSLGGPDAESFSIDRSLAVLSTKAGIGQRDERHLHGDRDGNGSVRAVGDHHCDH